MGKEYFAIRDLDWRFGGDRNADHRGFFTRAEAEAWIKQAVKDRDIPFHVLGSRNTTATTQPDPSVERYLPRDGERLDENQGQKSLANYYAVARGWTIGIYDSWEVLGGAHEQTHKFSGVRHRRFNDREAAIRYMEAQGIRRPNIRIFRAAFKQLENFKPNATAPFLAELDRYMNSQGLSKENQGKPKVDAIRTSLIQHLLPEGVPVDQEDEEEGIILSDAQTLRLYRKMCHKTHRVKGETIDGLRALKASPYINIVDFDASTTRRNAEATSSKTKSSVNPIPNPESSLQTSRSLNGASSSTQPNPTASHTGPSSNRATKDAARGRDQELEPKQEPAPSTNKRPHPTSTNQDTARRRDQEVQIKQEPEASTSRRTHPGTTSTSANQDSTRGRKQEVQVEQGPTASTNKRARTTTEEPPEAKRKRRTELELLAL
ncbi:Cauli-VI multi-domain protein [Pyrenophora tritici-repentis]|nr:Cauli-VI multi-domain protein [Pyrenophora tritici-repentis]